MDWFFIAAIALLLALLLGFIAFAIAAPFSQRDCIAVIAGVAVFLLTGFGTGYCLYNCQKAELEQRLRNSAARLENHNECIAENFAGGLELVPLHNSTDNERYLSLIRGNMCDEDDTCIMVAYQRENEPIDHMTVSSKTRLARTHRAPCSCSVSRVMVGKSMWTRNTWCRIGSNRW